jgi:uncharacterized protein YwgA
MHERSLGRINQRSFEANRMNRLQLATLLSWTGTEGFQGRKRLQKVVFFLQEAGCPLDCRYTLLHFGPYSRDVADRCDEMVAARLVEEVGGPTNGDMQYAYKLMPNARTALSQAPDPVMKPFQTLGTSLIKENLWKLELGSTILYFYRQIGDWDQAYTRACEFKNALRGGVNDAAFRLAQELQLQRMPA